jgi:hypothetical protein
VGVLQALARAGALFFGISLAAFLLLSFGWFLLVVFVILPALSRANIGREELTWIAAGLMGFSPLAAPIATIQALEISRAGRWQFWAIMSFWCLLACTFAWAMYVAVLRSFDRKLGRTRETIQKALPAKPPHLVAVGAACPTLIRHASPSAEISRR